MKLHFHNRNKHTEVNKFTIIIYVTKAKYLQLSQWPTNCNDMTYYLKWPTNWNEMTYLKWPTNSHCHFLVLTWHEYTPPGWAVVCKTWFVWKMAMTHRGHSWKTNWLQETGHEGAGLTSHDAPGQPMCCRPGVYLKNKMQVNFISNTFPVIATVYEQVKANFF